MDGTLSRTVDDEDFETLIANWEEHFAGLGINTFDDLKAFTDTCDSTITKRPGAIVVDGKSYKIKKMSSTATCAKTLAIAVNVQRPTDRTKVFNIAINYTEDKENALGVTYVDGDAYMTVDDGWHTTNGKMLGQLVYMIHKGWISRDDVEEGLKYILFTVEGIELTNATPEFVVRTVRAAKFISRNNDTTLATVLEQMFAALMDRNEVQRNYAKGFFDSQKILGVRPLDDGFSEAQRASTFSEQVYEEHIGTPTQEEFYWNTSEYNQFDNRKTKNGTGVYQEFALYNSAWHGMQVIKDLVPIGQRGFLNQHILIAVSTFIRECANANPSYVANNLPEKFRIDGKHAKYLNTRNAKKPLYGNSPGDFDVKLIEVLRVLFGTDVEQSSFSTNWKRNIAQYVPSKVGKGEDAHNPLYALGKTKGASKDGMLELIKWKFEEMYPDFTNKWNVPCTLDDYKRQFKANESAFTVQSIEEWDYEDEDESMFEYA